MSSSRFNRNSSRELFLSDIGLLLVTLGFPVITGLLYLIFIIAGLLILLVAVIVGSPLYLFSDSGATIRTIYNMSIYGILIFCLYTPAALMLHLMLFYHSDSDDDTPGIFAYAGQLGDGIILMLWWFAIPVGALALSVLWMIDTPSEVGYEILSLLFLFTALIMLVRYRGVVISLQRVVPGVSTAITSYLIIGGSIEAFSFIVGPNFIEFLFDDPELGMLTVYYPIFVLLLILSAAPVLNIGTDFFIDLLLFNVQTGEGFLMSVAIVFLVIPGVIYASLLSTRFAGDVLHALQNGYTWVVDSFNNRVIPTVVSVGYALLAVVLKLWGLCAYTILLRPRDER